MHLLFLVLIAAGVEADVFTQGSADFARAVRDNGNGLCKNAAGEMGPCMPGREFCGKPFENAPAFHLMDQHGCAENDPNGPVFDPVHGVIHHFYQIHLAADPGHGPDYGHFVSKDFVHWAALPVAIWNGFQVSPFKKTPYDNEAIFTGSGVVVDGAGPGGKGPGVVQIYPGLCNKNDWPSCDTGTVLAQAVPADYSNDELLTNWSKPSYNPIMENTQRDPSTPWKLPSGEWRLRSYDGMYGTASDADLLAGKWYKIGPSKDFRTCECPSFYPLPGPTPGFETHYAAAAKAGALPTHVHKTSCGGDWWQLGTYTAGLPRSTGTFSATPGWEDLYEQKKIDQGGFYASKDNEYPTKSGGKRRINWGWAQVPPFSTQTLPREISFNAAARTLEQAPISELKALRGSAISKPDLTVQGGETLELGLPKGLTQQSEVIASFKLPDTAATFGLMIGKGDAASTTVDTFMPHTDLPGLDYSIAHHPPGTNASVCKAACDADTKCQAWTYVIRGEPAGSGDCCLKSGVNLCPKEQMPSCTSGAKAVQRKECGTQPVQHCTAAYAPATNLTAPFHEVAVQCGSVKDMLRLLPDEKTIEFRVFSDATFVEVFFQAGRVAMTVPLALSEDSRVALTSTISVNADVTAYPMKGIWVSPEDVRKQPRVYSSAVHDHEADTFVV